MKNLVIDIFCYKFFFKLKDILHFLNLSIFLERDISYSHYLKAEISLAKDWISNSVTQVKNCDLYLWNLNLF